MLNGNNHGAHLIRSFFGLGFWQTLIPLLIGAIIFWVKVDTHVGDKQIHLTPTEQFVVSELLNYGLSHGADNRIKDLESRIKAIEDKLMQFQEEGRLQTPAEKVQLMKKAMRELLNENGYKIQKD